MSGLCQAILTFATVCFPPLATTRAGIDECGPLRTFVMRAMQRTLHCNPFDKFRFGWSTMVKLAEGCPFVWK